MQDGHLACNVEPYSSPKRVVDCWECGSFCVETMRNGVFACIKNLPENFKIGFHCDWTAVCVYRSVASNFNVSGNFSTKT